MRIVTSAMSRDSWRAVREIARRRSLRVLRREPENQSLSCAAGDSGGERRFVCSR